MCGKKHEPCRIFMVYMFACERIKKNITKYELFTQILTATSMAQDRQQKKK